MSALPVEGVFDLRAAATVVLPALNCEAHSAIDAGSGPLSWIGTVP